MKNKFSIAIDFDGTIIEEGFPFSDKVLPHAVTFIKKIKEEMDCYISIWTCRQGWFEDEAKKILKDNRIPFDDINQGNPQYNHSRKIYAHVYIDDKSCTEVNWESFYKMTKIKYQEFHKGECEKDWNKTEITQTYHKWMDSLKNKYNIEDKEELNKLSNSLKIMLGESFDE